MAEISRRGFLKYGITAAVVAAMGGVAGYYYLTRDQKPPVTPPTTTTTNITTPKTTLPRQPLLTIELGKKIDYLYSKTADALEDAVQPINPWLYNDNTKFEDTLRKSDALNGLKQYFEKDGLVPLLMEEAKTFRPLIDSGNFDKLNEVAGRINSLASKAEGLEEIEGSTVNLFKTMSDDLYKLKDGVATEKEKDELRGISLLLENSGTRVMGYMPYVQRLVSDCQDISRVEIEDIKSKKKNTGLEVTDSLKDYILEPFLAKNRFFNRAAYDKVTDIRQMQSLGLDSGIELLRQSKSEYDAVRGWVSYLSPQMLSSLEGLAKEGIDTSIFKPSEMDGFQVGQLQTLLKWCSYQPLRKLVLDSLRSTEGKKLDELFDKQLIAYSMDANRTYEDLFSDFDVYLNNIRPLLGFPFERYQHADPSTSKLPANPCVGKYGEEMFPDLKMFVGCHFGGKYTPMSFKGMWEGSMLGTGKIRYPDILINQMVNDEDVSDHISKLIGMPFHHSFVYVLTQKPNYEEYAFQQGITVEYKSQLWFHSWILPFRSLIYSSLVKNGWPGPIWFLKNPKERTRYSGGRLPLLPIERFPIPDNLLLEGSHSEYALPWLTKILPKS